jgi:hypothetical protein
MQARNNARALVIGGMALLGDRAMGMQVGVRGCG